MALIEREALLSEINKWSESVMYKDWVQSAIASAPATDAAPVAHGRWIKRDGYTECSECEYWYDSAESEDAGDRSNYCPNCGARMDGGKGREAD